MDLTEAQHLYRLVLGKDLRPPGAAGGSFETSLAECRVEEAAALSFGVADVIRHLLWFEHTDFAEIYLASRCPLAGAELRELVARLRPGAAAAHRHLRIDRGASAAGHLPQASERGALRLAFEPGRRRAVLAAHGAGEGSPANLRIHELAEEVSQRSGWRIDAAFHLGSPGFDAIRRSSDDVLVLPILTSEGWFHRQLTSSLAAEDGGGTSKRLLPVLGTHPGLTDVLLRHLSDALLRHGLDERDLDIVVVGHGTRRHARSGRSTEALAGAVKRRFRRAKVQHAFLDQDPDLEATLIAGSETGRPLAMLPFLLGGGNHAGRDLRAAAEQAGRRALLVPPLLDLPELPELLLALLRAGGRERALSAIEKLADRLADPGEQAA